MTLFLGGHVLILITFLAANLSMDMKKHFGTPHSVTNAVYYTVTTHSTTGYGDVTPKTKFARWMAVAHMMLVWTFTIISATFVFE